MEENVRMNRFFSAMRCLAIALSIALMLAPIYAPAQADDGPKGLSPEQLEVFDAQVAQAMKDFEIPGAVVVIVQKGQIAFSKGYGVRQLGKPEPVDAQTLFQIGSCSKAFTAMAVGTLVDQGKMAWDDPITQYLPGFSLNKADKGQSVTVLQALSNSSGVRRNDFDLMLDARDPQAIINGATDLPLDTADIVKYHYSNQMFSIAGFAAAKANGSDESDLLNGYRTLLQENIFAPLGMLNTTADLAKAQQSANHAFPHGFNVVAGAMDSLPMKAERFADVYGPAGGIWSTGEEMGRYVQMLLNQGKAADGTQVISADALATLWKPVIDAEGAQYALGWLVLETPTASLITHDGGTAGFSARVLLDAKNQAGIIILANSGGATTFFEAVSVNMLLPLSGQDTNLAKDYLDALKKQHEDAKKELATAVDQVAEGIKKPIDPDLAKTLVGNYGRAIVEQRDGQLWLITDLVESMLLPTPESTQKNAFILTTGFGAGTQIRFDVESDEVSLIFLPMGENPETRFTRLK
jgi:CubicO group peptidase (beta-lactamase class C family)